MLTTIKRMHKEISAELEIKSIFKANIFGTLFLLGMTFLLDKKSNHFSIMEDKFSLYLIAIIWIIPIVVFPILWYSQIKPIYDKHYKNTDLQKKYKFMLDKFNKTN